MLPAQSPSGTRSSTLSWNLGPTLTAYLADDGARTSSRASRPPTGGAAERTAGPASRSPSTTRSCRSPSLHDRRTEIRWGLRDFEHRFGRPAGGDVAAGDGRRPRDAAARWPRRASRPTILAPWQADAHHLDNRRPYRVDTGGGGHIDGRCSTTPTCRASVSFEPAVTADADRFARERIAPRLARPLPDGRPAPDARRSPATASSTATTSRSGTCSSTASSRPTRTIPDRGFDVVTLAAVAAEARRPPAPGDPDPRPDVVELPPRRAALVRRVPGAHDGRWKAPLRAALERLAGGIDAVTEALVRELPGAGRRLGGARRLRRRRDRGRGGRAFAADAPRRPVRPPRTGGGCSTLLEAQRWRLAMFASCGWFWDDPWRPETRQVLRCAARAVRIVDGLAGTSLERRLVEDLATFVSPALGIDGADDLPPGPERGRAAAAARDVGAPAGPGNPTTPGDCPGVVGLSAGRRGRVGARCVRRSGDADGVVRAMGIVREVPGVDTELAWR